MRSLPLVVVAALALAGCEQDPSSDANHATHLSTSGGDRPSRPGPERNALRSGDCPKNAFNWTPMLSGGGITVLTSASGHQIVVVSLLGGRLVTGTATAGPMDLPYSIEMPQVPAGKVKRVLLQASDGSHCLVSRG